MAQGYVYFVSYMLGTDPQHAAIGNAEFTLPHPITRMKHVQAIQEWLRQQLGVPNVIVINYQLLPQGPPR